jgi:hypothetical protein
MRSGSATGNQFTMSAFTSVKIAALAPIPSARVITAARVNVLAAVSRRNASRISLTFIVRILARDRKVAG